MLACSIRSTCLLSEQLHKCFPAHVSEPTRYFLTPSPKIEMLMLSFGQEDSQRKKWGFFSLIVLLAMTSCGDSMRDIWSWLFRWPQTRNLSTHSCSSWNMFWTQTTPQWIINTALSLCCQHLLSTPVSYRENRLGLIEYNHSTGEFVQLVLLRLPLRPNVCSLFMLFELSDQRICLCLY